MANHLSIDNKLLDAAVKVGGLKSKKDTVNLALEEFVKRRKTADILAFLAQLNMMMAMTTKKQGNGTDEGSRRYIRLIIGASHPYNLISNLRFSLKSNF
jgi:Arc/MetJ family transcription regulator